MFHLWLQFNAQQLGEPIITTIFFMQFSYKGGGAQLSSRHAN